MPSIFLNSIKGEAIFRALNWVLIHSLWQGMVLALLAAAILFFTKKSSPALRYNLLTVCLFVFVTAVAVTFSRQIIKAKHGTNAVPAAPAAQTNTIETPAEPAVTENKLSFTGSTVIFLNSNAKWMVLTWLLIITLQVVRLTIGLYSVRRLKTTKVFCAGDYLNSRITELCRQLHINKQVQLLQSGIAKMPAVIGYFKPVILFPAAMLSSLTANEVEAILIHELAHIRRKDFVINILQHLVEIVFFFNPAVSWVSSLIKSERENCCDEIAVTQTGSRQNYIRALLSFQQFNLSAVYPMANAFSGEKNHLINRVKRIIYNNNKTLNNMEKKFLAAGLLITGLCVFAFTSNSAQQKEAPTQITAPAASATEKNIPVTTDTVPAPALRRQNDFNGKTTTIIKGKKYTMVTENNKVSELYVNGKKVPAEEMDGYKNITDKITEQQRQDMESAEEDMAQAAVEQAQAKIEMEQADVELAQAKIEMEQAQKEMQTNQEDAKTAMEDSKAAMAEAKIEMEQAQEQMKQDMAQAKVAMQQAKREMARSKKEMEQSARVMEQSKRDMEQSEILQQKIIGDFIKEGIIKDKADLSSYQLNNEALIVNGVKQPDAVYKKFKSKYVKSSKWVITYNNSEETGEEK
jgi:bla regulator protein blaR1